MRILSFTLKPEILTDTILLSHFNYLNHLPIKSITLLILMATAILFRLTASRGHSYLHLCPETNVFHSVYYLPRQKKETIQLSYSTRMRLLFLSRKPATRYCITDQVRKG